MELAAVTNGLVLSWPLTGDFYELESSSELSDSNAWSNPAQIPSAGPSGFSLAVPVTSSSRFFRLRRTFQPAPAAVPDPETLAPALPASGFPTFADSTAFLYSGPNPVQLGMAPGVLDRERTAVLRGRVIMRENQPILGVLVSVLDHPEFGFTYTRADGIFDLAVNGGATLVLEFQRLGYCAAQRPVSAPQQDFRTIRDVALVPLDPVATIVSFGSNAPAQVATSSLQTDDAGSRSTTIFFPAGTVASLLLADGTTNVPEALTIHATEYTVGTNGLAAMPGALPPTSEYTYCVSFDAEEAIQAGARSIRFNQPVAVYQDNFLGVPIGTLVPNGYYDHERAVWVPEDNGIVLSILSTTNGSASLDLQGNGQPADAATLTAFKFTDAELRYLAANYDAGTSLWRSLTWHFSDRDPNFGRGTSDPARPNRPGDDPNPDKDDGMGNLGVVGLMNQDFSETIPLVGTSMALHYSSQRVPGHKQGSSKFTLRVYDAPGINFTFLYNLDVEVEVEVAGRVTTAELGTRVDRSLDYTFEWDGRDAYGRFIGGTHDAFVRVTIFPVGNPDSGGYRIAGVGLADPAAAQAQSLFANYGDVRFTGFHIGPRIGREYDFTRQVTLPDERKVGLGGWSLTPHHLLDIRAGILYKGDGTIQRTEGIGSGRPSLVDGTPVLIAAASGNTAILYTAVPNRLVRVDPDASAILSAGIVTPLTTTDRGPGITVVDGESYGVADGMLSTNVNIATASPPQALAPGRDGSVYFRTDDNICRIDPAGVLHIVVGSGAWPPIYPPDGTPGNQAFAPKGGNPCLAVGDDGAVYYNDSWNLGGTNYVFIRKVAPNGKIYTLAGFGGESDQIFDIGQKSVTAHLPEISALAVASSGEVYFAPATANFYAPSLLRISADGIIELVENNGAYTFAGIPNAGYSGEENQAAVTNNPPWGHCQIFKIVAGQDSTPYMLVQQLSGGNAYLNSIWHIEQNGFLQRVAGRWFGDQGLGSSPLETDFGRIYDFSIAPNGSLLLACADYLRRLGPPVATTPLTDGNGNLLTEFKVPSRDASELYVFDGSGHHLRTLDTLTGRTNWLFSYDSAQRLAGIQDANGLWTVIHRDAAGAPSSIEGPYGQTTSLELDSNGYLSKVTNPAGESTLLVGSSQGDGLLTGLIGPRKDTYLLGYTDDGRVTNVVDALANGSALSGYVMNGAGASFLTTPEGLRVIHNFAVLPDGTLYINSFSSLPGYGVRSEADALSGSRAIGYGNSASEELDVSGDPRFISGTQLPRNFVVGLPGGLKSQETLQRTVQLSDTNDPLSLVAMTNLFNVNGQTFSAVYTSTDRVSVVTSPEGRQLITKSDSFGRPSSVTLPGHVPVTLSYDPQGRVSAVSDQSSLGVRSSVFSYDALGRLLSSSTPAGATTMFDYDAANRLSGVTLPDGAHAYYTNDSEYNVTAIVTPGGGVHRFAYSAGNLMTNYAPPAVAGGPTDMNYEYTPGRALAAVHFPDGQDLLFSYSTGRLASASIGGAALLTFGYETNASQLSSVSDSRGESVAFGYQGPLITNCDWSGAITGRVGIALAPGPIISSHSINGTSTVSYAYDQDSLLTQAGPMRLNRNPGSGLITNTVLGAVTDFHYYDERGLTTNYTAVVNGTNLWSVTLLYDAIDRITNRIEVIAGTTRSTAYSYDSRGRLAKVVLNGSAETVYKYDANGNRLSRNTETGTYDPQDRVLTYGGATFTWSPNGYWAGRSQAGQTTYTYDLNGSLTAVALPDGRNIQYTIDPTGQRVGKKVNGSLQAGWLWDGDFLVAELGADRTLSKHFVYAENNVVPSFYMSGTNAFRMLSDDRGSVRFVIDAQTGTVVETMDYDEFGRLLADNAPGLQPFGFAGGQYDPDTGLIRFGSRDYSPETGTWTRRDSIGFAGGQLNLFAYAGGDPINHVDPLGTGPFGFLNRNRQRAIDAAFDTSPGNNQRFANALDRYNKSVNATVVTAQVLVTTGNAVNHVAWALAGARAAGSSLTSSSADFASSRASMSSSGRAPMGRTMAQGTEGGSPGLPGGSAPGTPVPEPAPPPPPAPTPTPPTPGPPAFSEQDTILQFL